MSDCTVNQLDLDSQRLIQNLIDKLIYLNSEKDFGDEIKLFTHACGLVDLKLNTYFREDISNIFMLSCQIILNENICIVTGSGKSEEKSYKNAVMKFLDYAFTQRNQALPLFTMECDHSFVDELIENFEDLSIIDAFVFLCKDFFEKTKPSFNYKTDYQRLKDFICETHLSKYILSESYRPGAKNIICSIFLNKRFLLQQGRGEKDEDAFENTIKEMFNSYTLISEITETNGIVHVSMDKQTIIRQMAEQFNAIKIDSKNHWDTIQKCADLLNFCIKINCNLNTCIVKINDTIIIDVHDDTDYCASVKACKKLVELFSKTPKPSQFSRDRKRETVSVENSVKTPNIISNKKIKELVEKVRLEKERLKNENDDRQYNVWTLVNTTFLDNDVKLELHYDVVKGETNCLFAYQSEIIVSAKGNNKNESREAAAKKLIANENGMD